MLLSQHDECEHAEERRLFYVAITRSRVQTYVLTDEWNESVFVEELSGAAYAGRVAAPERRGIAVSCPQCQGGRLRERKNEYGVFWICSNYPYCNELVRPCAACGEGPFVREQNIYRCRNEACGVKADVCPECGVGALIVVHGRYGDFLGCTEWRREGAACFYKRNLRPR